MFPVLLFLTTLTFTTSIPSNKVIQGLQTGLFTFQRANQQQSQLFMWQFEQPFTQIPQLGLAISSLQMKAGQLFNGIDLKPEAITSTGVIISWKRQVNKWVYLTINYMASTRNDIILGYSHLELGNQPQATTVIKFGQSIPNQKTSIARLYLIGCSTDSQVFDCNVTGQSFTQNSLAVLGSVGTSGHYRTKNSSISVSYIIFSPSTASFSSYGGMIDKDNFMGSFSSNVRKIIYKTDNFIFGFSMLSFKGEQKQSLTASIDMDLILTIEIQNEANFKLIYIAVGKSSKQSCVLPSAPFEWQNQCLSVCPANSYPYKYSNGGMACLGCSPKLHLVLNANNQCVCQYGFMMKDKSCLPDVTSVQSQSRMTEQKPEDSKNMTNLLKLFHTMQSRHTKAHQIQPESQSISNPSQHSTYPSGQHSPINHATSTTNNNDRVYTKPVFHSDPAPPQTNTIPVRPIPQLNDTLSGHRTSQPTVCLPTFVDQGRNVIQPGGTSITGDCGQNGYMIGGLCFCRPGYWKVNGKCIVSDTYQVLQPLYEDTLLTQPQTPTCGSGSCFTPQPPTTPQKPPCSSGSCFTPSPPSHPPISSCPGKPNSCLSGGCEGQRKDDSCCIPPAFIGCDGRCQCPSGYFLYNDGCLSCPQPGVFDYSTGKCEYYCGENAQYLEDRKECVCKEGFGVAEDGSCQLCDGRSYLKDGYCVTCPDHKIYNTHKKQCVCPKGSLIDGNCQCVDRCGQFQIYDQTKQSCQCQPLFGRYLSKCRLCDFGKVSFLDKCLPCQIGYQRRFVDGECKCSPRLIEEEGRCKSCESISGAFVRYGTCVKCPIGFISGEQHNCTRERPQRPIRPPRGINHQEQIFSGSNLPPGSSGSSSPQGLSINPSITPSIKTQSQPTPDNAINIAGVNPICGNGLIEGLQECDDRNTANGDGCDSSCKVQPGYICQRMPSRCSITSGSTTPTETVSTPTNTQPTATPDKDLSLQGNVMANSNQIYLTLNTVKPFDFANQQEMKDFIKAKFQGCAPPTAYCSQQSAPNKQLFDCLLIFPSGVPNSPFTAIFSYDFKGSNGQATIKIDSLTLNGPTSSNGRRNSRRRQGRNIS